MEHLQSIGSTVGSDAARDEASTAHAYPRDLARFVSEVWEDDGLPEGPVLEALLSTCYQASLLREEERPVNFRLILADPGLFAEDGGPPEGLHRLEFTESRPFNEREIRSLSPAADFDRSLIGAAMDESGEIGLWGVVHSGPRWLRHIQGGREPSAPLPPVPVVKVSAPGRLEVCRGSEPVAELDSGKLSGSHADVFASRWLPDMFAPVRAEIVEAHEKARREALRAGESWAPLDPDLVRKVAQQMLKRLVSTVSGERHGGTIVIVPPSITQKVLGGECVYLKHVFTDADSRRRFRTLIVRVMNRLAQTHGKGGDTAYPRAVGWEEYTRSEDKELADLDEAIFEFAHLVAGLAAVDGAVVMTQRYELLGFGGEISGDLAPVDQVRRALDLEGERTVGESVEGSGTRHRSAYRLARALPDTLTVVVSQDGDARFVKSMNGSVTCWDQA